MIQQKSSLALASGHLSWTQAFLEPTHNGQRRRRDWSWERRKSVPHLSSSCHQQGKCCPLKWKAGKNTLLHVCDVHFHLNILYWKMRHFKIHFREGWRGLVI